jgi:hypothetical protein
MCEENKAWLTLDDWNGVSLFLLDVLEYQIASWSSSRVTAERQASCFTALMTFDIKAQQAPQSQYHHATHQFAPGIPHGNFTR